MGYRTPNIDRLAKEGMMFIRRDYIVFAANVVTAKWAATFKEFPPIQKPNSFTIDDAIGKMAEAGSGG